MNKLSQTSKYTFIPTSVYTIVFNRIMYIYSLTQLYSLLSSPTYLYGFVLQPDFGRYASLLHLKPWHIVVIPITLNSVMDMSSVLEIALQLNALNVSWQFNETYREVRNNGSLLVKYLSVTLL